MCSFIVLTDMNIYVTKTHLFDQDLFQNLLILLNRDKRSVQFKPLPSSIILHREELQTRCIPHDKLWKKFIIQPSLLVEVIKVLRELDTAQTLLQSTTFSTNTIYARSIMGTNAAPSNEYKKYALLKLVYGMLRISFVNQSYPLAYRLNKEGTQELACDASMEHDVFVDTKLLFQKCKEQRIKQNLAEDDFLVLFTSVNIDANWIYSLDPTYANNIVINLYPLSNVLINEQLPAAIVYYMVTGILAKLMHWSFVDWYLHQHPHPKGCIMDFNYRHEEAVQTMYASSICPTCRKLLATNKVSTELLDQFEKIMEGSRKEFRRA